MTHALDAKREKLFSLIKSYGSLAVAFSGGVDSTLLLKVASEALGKNACAYTVTSPLSPKADLKDALSFCKKNKIHQVPVDFDPFKVRGFAKNSGDRCYLCKKKIFSLIKKQATLDGITVVADGSNKDDEGDYRPGLKALEELGIKSPFRECGFTKADIRALSKEYDLPTAQKPSAACLASRISYNEKITVQKLQMVERAETFLRKKILSGPEMGFAQIRVRAHNGLARIETENKFFYALLEKRDIIEKEFSALGFLYTTLDLTGFKSGSMNREIVHKN